MITIDDMPVLCILLFLGVVLWIGDDLERNPPKGDYWGAISSVGKTPTRKPEQ